MEKMIATMTKKERYDDIAKRANVDVEVVKHIIKHEYASYKDSLSRGEKIVIPGYGTCEPLVKKRLNGTGIEEKYVSVKQTPSGVLIDDLNKIEDFKIKKGMNEDVIISSLNELA